MKIYNNLNEYNLINVRKTNSCVFIIEKKEDDQTLLEIKLGAHTLRYKRRSVVVITLGL